MTIELRELKWAIVAAQYRSLRRAAETLNIRQSTLSRSLRQLESKLGGVLFERTNGGTNPTPEGKEFVEAARRIAESLEIVASRFRASSLGKTGHLTIGVHVSLATGNLKATLAEYHRKCPAVAVQIVDGARERLLAETLANAIDVAVVIAQGGGWDDRSLSLWSERVIVALPEGHSLCDRAVLKWADLAGYPILVQERGAGPEMQRLLEAKLGAFASQRFSRQDGGIDRLMGMVGAGFGLYLLFEGATGAHYDDVVYREVHDPEGPTRVNFAACWRGASRNPTLKPFLELLENRYPDLSAAPGPQP